MIRLPAARRAPLKAAALASAALLVALASPAGAQTLRYTLTGNDLDGTVEYASFRLPVNPVILPNNVGVGEGFRTKFVSGVFQYGGTVLNLQDLQFFNGAAGGGFISLDPTDTQGVTTFLNFVGPQLYTATEANPTLTAGQFDVFDAYTGAQLSLTVAAVPEPASWALMIAGFGATGAALRRRRATVRTSVRFA